MPSFPTNSPIQSSLHAQFELLTELTRRSCDVLRKISELQLQLAQQMLQESSDTSRRLLACNDVFQLAAASASAAAPAAQHLHDYQRRLFGLLNDVRPDFRNTARQP